MRVGIATDHGGFGLKEDLVARKNLHHGVREHATAAIVNGLSISKLRAFGVTFFIFSDYARPSNCRRFSSLRMTRWVTARTARRTSRLNTSH
jgi:transketolase